VMDVGLFEARHVWPTDQIQWQQQQRRTLRVNFHWNILEIDQDNLRTKLNCCCCASH